MFFTLASLLLLVTPSGSSNIIFPTSFPSPERENVDPYEVKNLYQRGIDAVLSVAGLVQNLLLQETVNFAAKNWVISPVSLAGIFAQLLMGSRGEIRQTLSHALSMADYDCRDDYKKLEVHRQLGSLLKYLHHPGTEDYSLLINSVVFLQKGFPLKATYRHALLDFYNTKIYPMDFRGKSSDSLAKISEWVKNSTSGRFSDLIQTPLPPNIVSLMANIVYFKGTWEMPFEPDYTQPGWFTVDQNRKIWVDYMHGEQQVLYGNTSDYQLIGLPYKGRDIVIYIILPNGNFSTKMAMKQLDAIASSARLENITLVLPKVKISTSFSVKNAVAKYLVKKPGSQPRRGCSGKEFIPLDVLEKQANIPLPLSVPSSSKKNGFDMGGASDDIRFKIDDVIHKVSLELDEVGTEAVAVTSTLIDHSGNDFIIKVNRPFLFFVRHEITLAHLFWGLVANPGTSKTSPKNFNDMW